VSLINNNNILKKIKKSLNNVMITEVVVVVVLIILFVIVVTLKPQNKTQDKKDENNSIKRLLEQQMQHARQELQKISKEHDIKKVEQEPKKCPPPMDVNHCPKKCSPFQEPNMWFPKGNCSDPLNWGFLYTLGKCKKVVSPHPRRFPPPSNIVSPAINQVIP